MDDEETSRPCTHNNTAFTTTTSVMSSHIGRINYDEEEDQSSSNFEVSDFLEFDNNNDWFDEYPTPPTTTTTTTMIPASFPQNLNNLVMPNNITDTSTNSGAGGIEESTTKERVAFRIKSSVEILDDGFKWRKYGKKMVKNSPNPRNYYRCSVDGCKVKKRVERDNDDPTYIITTYEGTHNHPSPGQILDFTNVLTF